VKKIFTREETGKLSTRGKGKLPKRSRITLKKGEWNDSQEGTMKILDFDS